MMIIFSSLIFLGLILLLAWQWRLRLKAVNAYKNAKSEIRVRERKIQTILDNAPIVFSAIDANGIFYISEGKGLEKLGRKSNQSVGVSIYEMHKYNPFITDAVTRALNGEQVATNFILNGVHYELFISPEKDETGTVVGATMLSVDITDRKKVEEEKAQLLIREQTAIETTKLKSEFLANMSHEIRTPLNGVLGMTSLLMDTSLSSQQREFAKAIQDSGSSLLTVLNDILDLSKIEAGRLDFEKIDFHLTDLIEHTLNALRFLSTPKGLQLTTEFADDLPEWVKGDPARFKQVLNNLVANAIKFTERGHVIVRVSKLNDVGTAQEPTVRIEIEDTGIGIAKDSLRKMFVAFSQAEASMSRRFGGSGLGLSISKQLVERMGGAIGVESVEHQGSTFWVNLPFEVGEAPAEDVRTSAPIAGSPVLSETAPLVLVAEDNKVNQIITSRMLEKLGCRVETVADGLKVLKALETSDYDLVLMDCQMPNLDGLEATSIFRASESPRNKDVPILAMTASAMKGDREKCLEAGMNDYISKPISFNELSATIARWLKFERNRKTTRQ